MKPALEDLSLTKEGRFGFSRRIEGAEDSWPEMMRYLRHDGLPVLLLGAGALGRRFLQLLGTEGIAVTEVVVNRRYWRAGDVLDGHVVNVLEDVLLTYPRVNVLCALQYLKTSEKNLEWLKESGRVERVLVYDTGCIHHGFRDFTVDFVEKHKETFETLYETLADERSRDTLVAYARQRLTGRPGSLAAVYDDHHLFPPEIVNLNPNEVFVDCGAFDGESILDFEREMRLRGFEIEGPILALEPDADSRRRLEVQCAHLSTLRIVPLGAWKETAILGFSDGEGSTSRLTASGTGRTEVGKLDDILRGIPVSYIKMDVEGAELEALEGAIQVIETLRPKLGVCVYHRVEDLITIPQFIRRLMPEARLFLRAHSYGANNLLLYAV